MENNLLGYCASASICLRSFRIEFNKVDTLAIAHDHPIVPLVRVFWGSCMNLKIMYITMINTNRCWGLSIWGNLWAYHDGWSTGNALIHDCQGISGWGNVTGAVIPPLVMDRMAELPPPTAVGV